MSLAMAETCNGAFLFTMAGAPCNSVQGECDKEGETGLVERDEASIIHVVVLRVLQRDKPPWTTVHTRTTTSRRRRRRDVRLEASYLLSLSLSPSRGKTWRDASSSNAYVILNWKISMQTAGRARDYDRFDARGPRDWSFSRGEREETREYFSSFLDLHSSWNVVDERIARWNL